MLVTQSIDKKDIIDEGARQLIDGKLIEAYQIACNDFQEACERYEMLVRVYERMNQEADAGEEATGSANAPAYAVLILKRMVTEAQREKSMIAAKAAEYIKLLRSTKYIM